jgi:putative addiction module antidote
MTVFQFLGIVDFPSRLYNDCYIGGDMLSFKVTTVGSSEGFILNKEAKAKLNVKKGDVIFLTEAPDGALRITPFNPDFERQMLLAEEIMNQDREILKVLAK